MPGGTDLSVEYEGICHMMKLEAMNAGEGMHDVHALIAGYGTTGLQAFQ